MESPTLSQQDLQRLAEIVREVTGNVVQEKNYSMLESRIKTHLLHLKITTMDNYWSYFSKNESQEREVIQSLMTTHHTFFFREYLHFEVLGRWIERNIDSLKSRWDKDKTPLRVWSAASSRGQEAYSLAMFLEAELFQKHGIEFSILGTDIDKESVAYATNGVYHLKEVNAIPRQYLGSLWKMGTGSVKEFAAAGTRLRSRVKFETLNLFGISTWENKSFFDVIFCRNVFIYFSEPDVQKIALALSARLSKNGLFVSGISEPLRFKDWTLSGIGANCYVSAPAEKVTTTPTASSNSEISNPGSQQKRYRVLAVDDSGTIQALLKKVFSQDPFCDGVESAMNGQEAAEKLKHGKFDVMTLDIHMPVMTGIQFLEQVYRKKEHPPVIMISSVNRTDVELATKAITLGAFDYVEKPAMNNLQKSTTEVLTKVRMALRAGRNAADEQIKDFETTIASKIIIPDASQCLRVIFASESNVTDLEHVVRGQNGEGRSPAALICWTNPASRSEVESKLLNWTQRSVEALAPEIRILRPNFIYVGMMETAKTVLSNIKVKSKSIQVLDPGCREVSWSTYGSVSQVLVSESVAGDTDSIGRQLGLPVSDITPATSFPSLSAEYFANLRKAA